ncbi:MAG: phosphotransferase, partial [Anaerolineales bacterium]
KTFMGRVEEETFDEPIAARLATFLNGKRAEILDLVERTERLAQALRTRSPEFVLCHSDIHAGNILIDVNGNFYIVDWDDPILAPKERDLMYAGGGQFGVRRTPEEEETLFYRGYGQTQVDPDALAYYRYERIIEDIAVYCEELLLTEEGGADREQAYRYLTANFLPGNVLEIAYKSDRTR